MFILETARQDIKNIRCWEGEAAQWVKTPAGKPAFEPQNLYDGRRGRWLLYLATHTWDEGRKKEIERINIIVKIFLRIYITSVYHNLK